ncbi:MAG TPA: class I SAM-dependent methyltransferase family protein, partial [Polyangiaceae bacterium]|nr:class I SAM-dependent methyltransferase family protein [Polyangiaceae bacterium]
MARASHTCVGQEVTRMMVTSACSIHGPTGAWEQLGPAIADLKELVLRADREASRKGTVSPATAALIESSFADFEVVFGEMLDSSACNSDEATRVGARVRSELHPYTLLSANAERWCSKPRGYAGDFLTIAGIYEDAPAGVGRVGPLLDRCFLNLAAARAVRNRRPLLAREIEATVSACDDRAARVTSLACGPAAEVFDVYEALPDPAALRTTLLDMDLHALAYVADRRDSRRLR